MIADCCFDEPCEIGPRSCELGEEIFDRRTDALSRSRVFVVDIVGAIPVDPHLVPVDSSAFRATSSQ
jgi:hypothetical protein